MITPKNAASDPSSSESVTSPPRTLNNKLPVRKAVVTATAPIARPTSAETIALAMNTVERLGVDARVGLMVLCANSDVIPSDVATPVIIATRIENAPINAITSALLMSSGSGESMLTAEEITISARTAPSGSQTVRRTVRSLKNSDRNKLIMTHHADLASTPQVVVEAAAMSVR